jgi:PadR family transcriptional regulator, regulatory protein PadR
MEANRAPRMTQLVLRALLADPAQELYGVEIGQAAGLPRGAVHPILARIEGVGWLISGWEDIDPRAEGRPAAATTV